MGDSVKSCFLIDGVLVVGGVVTCFRRAARAFRSYGGEHRMEMLGDTCSLSRSAMGMVVCFFPQSSRSTKNFHSGDQLAN